MDDDVTGESGGGPPSYPGGGGSASPAPPSSAPPPPPPFGAPTSGPPPMPPPPPPGSYPASAGYPAPGGFPPPGPFAAPGSGYANWGIRLGGWLIDFAIFFVVQIVLGGLFRHSNTLTIHFTNTMSNGTVRHTRFDILVLFITALIAIVYATVLVGGPRGQTVGMMAVGIRAVGDGNHGPIGYGRAFWRSVVEQVFRFTVIVWIIDMLFPLWDGKRQTLHDKVVGTVVLRVRNAG